MISGVVIYTWLIYSYNLLGVGDIPVKWDILRLNVKYKTVSYGANETLSWRY